MISKTCLFNLKHFLALFLLVFLVSSCWSPRCPKRTCKVMVEHRHESSYYRPREAFSWIWSRKYKHIRTTDYAAAGPNSTEKVKIWNRILKRTKRRNRNHQHNN